MLKITDNEKRDIIKYLESGKSLPKKYRFLLFDNAQRSINLIYSLFIEGNNNMISPLGFENLLYDNMLL